MADFRAIRSVCDAVINILHSNYRSEDFNGHHLDFKVFLHSNFSKPMDAGVSLFLYRIFYNGSHRTPAGRIGPDGQRFQPKLPLDLHFMLTAWANDASLQHTIAGWMMRVLEDNTIVPASLLNAVTTDVFQSDEIVELCMTELKTEDMFRIWETISDKEYRISVPYMARNIRIESEIPTGGMAVTRRAFDYYKTGA